MRSASLIALGYLAVVLAGCGDPARETAPSNTARDQRTHATSANMEQWGRSCAICHVNGEGGAPRVGDAEDWNERLQQGEEVLLAHTVEGFNNMPPLGYCMDCEEQDLRALIRFMAGIQ